MKSSTLLLCLFVWGVSLSGAYYLGSSKEELPEQAQTTSKPSKKSNVIASPTKLSTSGSVELPVEENFLAAYLEGKPVSLAQALNDVSTLSASDAQILLGDALALPLSDPNRSRMIRALLSQLADSDPLAAMEIADGIDSLRDSERARVAILQSWGRNDPTAALAWANQALADEPRRTRQSKIDAIYRGYAQTNPGAAFQEAMLLDDDRLKRGILSNVIEIQVENGGLEAAKLTIDTLSDAELQSSLRRQLVDEWASYDPVAAASYVESLGEAASSNLKSQLVEEWAESDPAAAAAWLSSLDSDDPAIARASSDLIQEWARYDLNASAEWLNSLEPSPELDRAVISYTFRAAEEDPETAMSWAESIEDDRRRTFMMERVAGSWKEQSPESFATYLDGAELSEEQRETLVNASVGGERRRGGGGGRGGPGGGRGGR